MNYLIALAFVAILGSLAAALFLMLRSEKSPKKPRSMAKALALRVGFSVALFLCILLAYKLGYIHPSGIRVPL